MSFVEKTSYFGCPSWKMRLVKCREYDNSEDYYDMYEEYGDFNYLDEEDEYERVKVRGFEL